MKRIAFVLLLVLGVTAATTLAADTFVVGVEQSTKDSWQSLASSFQTATGIAVSIQPLSQSAIGQQVTLQAFTRSGRLHFVMIAESWGPTIARYLQDLSAVSGTLAARGVTPVSINGRSVGVPISFAPGWFLAVLSWPQNQSGAVDFLVTATLGTATGSSSPTSTPTPLSVAKTYTTGKLAASQHSPKLDGALESLIAAAQSTLSALGAKGLSGLPSSALAALSTVADVFGVPFSPTAGTITVVMESSPGRSGASNAAALSALGISGASVEASSTLLKVTVPVGQLAALVSQLSGVAFVRAPYEPYALATAGQGVAAIGAGAFHSAGLTGTGARVAVIDLGFYGLAQAQSRGDLPATLTQVDLTGTGLTSGISHGTAVAEIIYEVAPSAELYLIKIGDDVDLDQAVTYCLANGIDIINHSLGWYNTNNYDGMGTIGDIARRATSGGILWVNAAGNEAQSHWQSGFADANSDGWHDTPVTFYATSGSSIMIYLTWNEWPQSSSDYDLYLYDPLGGLVASSTKYQTGTEEPTESIQTTASQTGTYSIRVHGAGSRTLNLYNLYQGVSPAVASSSILAPADVAEVVAVGAINYANYASGPQEPYSSQGPTTDGRTKPDLVCPDNVSTGTAPYTSFAGTSGAAPHAAGAAALLLSAQPSLSGSALRSQLLASTVPMGSANAYGQGRLVLQAPAAPNQPPTAAFIVSPSPALVGQTVTFNGTGSVDPDGTIAAYTWSFGDGMTSSGSSTSHAYAAAGTYTATLTVQDNSGATASTTRPVVVSAPSNQPPVASFTLSPSTTQPGVAVSMNASASYDPDGAIASYSWTFGDGNAGTGVTTSHAYSSAGTYTVTLTVQDNGGATGTTSRQVLVQAPSLPDLAVQSLTYVPTGPTVGQSVTFSVVVANQGAASAGAFRVRLDGSSLSTTASSATLGAGAARSFSLVLPLTLASETFTVRVDDLGQVAESNETNNTQAVAVNAVSPAPVAEAGGPYTGLVGGPITLNGSASAGSISTYAWAFGDGTTGAGAVVAHPYAYAGTYTATLTVAGPGGQSTDTAQVSVGATQPALTVDVSLPKSVYTVGESISITLTVNRSAYVYLVEITPDNRVVLLFPSLYEPNNALAAGSRALPGAAYTLRASEPVGAETLRLFAATGPIPGFPTSFGLGFPTLSTNPTAFVNTVLATMQSAFAAGDRATDTISLTVQPAPLATGTLRVLSSPSGATVRLDGASIGTTNLERPNVSPGTHTVEVSLVGYQTETRQATIVAGSTTPVQVTLTPILVNQPPIAAFTYSPTSPGVGTPVQFDASPSADPDGTIISYAWNFGDTGTAVGPLVSHTYAASGGYTVQLTVTDNGGTTAQVSRLVVVSAPSLGPETPPAMGSQPGIYVWGDQRWHITVNSGPSWTAPHAYKILISAARVESLEQAVQGGAVPLASFPPAEGVIGYQRTIQGTLSTGAIDFSFLAPQASILHLSLLLDVDGDGHLDESASLIYLGQNMVHPTRSLVPLRIGLPEGAVPPFAPSMNYRLGFTTRLEGLQWVTDIRSLGG
jgi:PKD repeat protein